MPLKSTANGTKSQIDYNNIGSAKNAMNAFNKIAARLELVKERLVDPQPALNAIVAEFGVMEAERFMNDGSAPDYGVGMWFPTESSSIKDRETKGGNGRDQTLLNFGYLGRAASNPELDYVGTKAVKLVIDPRREAPKSYSHGKNYAGFHQMGMGNNPTRKIVEIKPQFVLIANRIIQYYLIEGTAKKMRKSSWDAIPSNKEAKMKALKNDLRNYERRMARKKEGLHTFGESLQIHSGRGYKIYDRQATTVGGSRIGKRGY